MKNIQYRLVGLLVLSMSLVVAARYAHVGSTDHVYQTMRQKKKLFAKVGCTYMNKMEIDCRDGSSTDSTCLVNPYDTDYFKADPEYVQKLSQQYYDDVVHAKLAPMYLKFISPVVGYGIFATRAIQKDEFIGVYAGELRHVRWGQKDFKEDVDYAWYYTVDGADGKKMIVDGKYRGNELRFINHAKHPNTKRIDVIVDGVFYICYVATRYIPQDTQLTVSYGEGYWTTRNINPDDVG